MTYINLYNRLHFCYFKTYKVSSQLKFLMMRENACEMHFSQVK